MQTRTIAAMFVALITCAAVAPARADISAGNVDVAPAITSPLSGFNVNYMLFGSSVLATTQLNFYLASSATGNTTYRLKSMQVGLGRAGTGLYLPPSGVQTTFISGSSMAANTYALLQSITASCQPTTWYIQVRADFGSFASDSTLLGSAKLPDFFFSGGSISPTTINPGGTTNIAFTLANVCPAPQASNVGVYLADASYNLLSFIGDVGISAGSGPFSLPPTPISFSSAIPTGNYNIILIADVDGIITESNESNNAGALAFSVVAPLTSSAAPQTGALRTEAPLPQPLPAALQLRSEPAAKPYEASMSVR